MATISEIPLDVTVLVGTHLLPTANATTGYTEKLTIDQLQDYLNIQKKKSISGTSYTLLASDKNLVLLTESASATSITIPHGLFPEGTTIHVSQDGNGQVTFVEGSNVTLQVPASSNKKTRGIHSTITLWLKTKGVTDVWKAWGDIEPST